MSTSRRQLRERIVQLLYQMDMLDDYQIGHHDRYELSDFQIDVLEAFIANRREIDSEIELKLVDWSLKTISKVDLACIRMALTEIKYLADIPLRVSINEAVEMAKLFGDDDTRKFVNGVLRSISDDY